MRVIPIMAIQPIINPPKRQRAVMSIRHLEHTVVNLDTGERTTLPARQAWELHDRLNEVAAGYDYKGARVRLERLLDESMKARGIVC